MGSLLVAFPSSSVDPDVQDDPTMEHLGTPRVGSKEATTSIGVGGSVVGRMVGELVGPVVGDLVGEDVGLFVG